MRTLDALPEREPGGRRSTGAPRPRGRRAPRRPRRARRRRAARAGGRAIVAQTQRTLSAARAAGVAHVVVVTSAVVHGAWLDRPVIHDGDDLHRPDEADPRRTRRRPARVRGGRSRAAARRRTPLLTVLRPAALVGPGIDTFVTRHFEAPRLLTVRGAVRPVAVRARRGRRGGGPVRGRPRAHRRADRGGARRADARAGRGGGGHAPDRAGRDHGVRHRRAAAPGRGAARARVRARVRRLPVDGRVRRAASRPAGSRAGRAPRASTCCSRACRAGSAVAGRRVGARDAAALGAAGAAVALIGTAAVWRQARGARRT